MHPRSKLCEMSPVVNASGVFLNTLGGSAKVAKANYVPVGPLWNPIATIHALDGVRTYVNAAQQPSGLVGTRHMHPARLPPSVTHLMCLCLW